MILDLIEKNIIRNKLGSILIIIPIALVVILFVSTFSIMGGVSNEVYEKYEGNVFRTLLPVFIDETTDQTFYNKIIKTKDVYIANPALLVEENVNDNKDKIVILCGPPIMITKTIEILIEKGFNDDQIFLSAERLMYCGMGKCGRCMIHGKYTCLDGSVFRYDDLKECKDG